MKIDKKQILNKLYVIILSKCLAVIEFQDNESFSKCFLFLDARIISPGEFQNLRNMIFRQLPKTNMGITSKFELLVT